MIQRMWEFLILESPFLTPVLYYSSLARAEFLRVLVFLLHITNLAVRRNLQIAIAIDFVRFCL